MTGVNWQERILTEDELKPFYNAQSDYRFSVEVAALIEQQKANWQSLIEGYRAFSQVETRRIEAEGSSVIAQHNPARVRSTAAAVDKASVQARKCFLCAENLPAEEKAIAYNDNFVILCNPYPVVDNHLVIAHKQHIEQKIEGHIEDLLALAFDLGESYFVLYNGAECGASAPDHLHFQAGSRALLPIEDVLRASELPAEIECDVCEDLARRDFELFTIADFGRSAIIFRGASRIEISSWVNEIIQALRQTTGKPEPMMNLICFFERGVFTFILFPRARHRPSCFYAEGEDRLVISPGAVDMAGVLVIPQHEHFEKLGALQVETIFSEVSLHIDAVEEVVGQACASNKPVMI